MNRRIRAVWALAAVFGAIVAVVGCKKKNPSEATPQTSTPITLEFQSLDTTSLGRYCFKEVCGVCCGGPTNYVVRCVAKVRAVGGSAQVGYILTSAGDGHVVSCNFDSSWKIVTGTISQGISGCIPFDDIPSSYTITFKASSTGQTYGVLDTNVGGASGRPSVTANCSF